MAKFYMQRYDIANQQPKDLETDFNMFYVECKGLSDKGKPKNIYVERYSDSAEDRVFIPENVYYEPTDLEMTFIFKGNARRNDYDSFCEYIKKGKFYYWDTLRHRKVSIILLSSIQPSDDIFKMNPKYIKVAYTFTNLKGCSIKCNDNGEAI